MKLSWIGLCLAAILAGGLLAGSAEVASEPLDISGRCLTSPEASSDVPLQMARMDPSKCVIWCKIKRGNCAEDCAASAGDKLKSCKEGCRATFEACMQSCS
ncbi:MAG: hypothetical protein WDZ84_05895 [Rhodovibrionaceae bacterium]